MEQENEFITAYKRVFPRVSPSIFQLEMIVGRVSDAQAWMETLEFWAGNDYRPQSIFKMCNYYDEVIQKRNPTAWQSVGKWDGTVKQIDEKPCETCGQTYCLKDHRFDSVPA